MVNQIYSQKGGKRKRGGDGARRAPLPGGETRPCGPVRPARTQGRRGPARAFARAPPLRPARWGGGGRAACRIEGSRAVHRGRRGDPGGAAAEGGPGCPAVRARGPDIGLLATTSTATGRGCCGARAAQATGCLEEGRFCGGAGRRTATLSAATARREAERPGALPSPSPKHPLCRDDAQLEREALGGRSPRRERLLPAGRRKASGGEAGAPAKRVSSRPPGLCRADKQGESRRSPPHLALLAERAFPSKLPSRGSGRSAATRRPDGGPPSAKVPRPRPAGRRARPRHPAAFPAGRPHGASPPSPPAKKAPRQISQGAFSCTSAQGETSPPAGAGGPSPSRWCPACSPCTPHSSRGRAWAGRSPSGAGRRRRRP